MNTKSLSGVEFNDNGTVEAVFATLDVKDSDGDVTIKGAFPEGKTVKISAFNHTSWQGALPIGKGTIHEEGGKAVFRGEFFKTQAAQETREVLKGLGRDAEWSYGFDVVDSEPGEFKGESVRFLKRMNVHEVSPVLIGAGVDTHTRDVKASDSSKPKPRRRRDEDEDESGSRNRRRNDDDDSRSRDDGDDGEEHMGERMQDRLAEGEEGDEREQSDVSRRRRDSGKSRLSDDLQAVLADLEDVTERAAEVKAMRAQKGKGLGSASTYLALQIKDQLKELEEVLSEPEPEPSVSSDELAREYLRYLQMTSE